MRIEEIIGKATLRFGVVRVSGAMNPFLWSMLWTIGFLTTAVLPRDDQATKFLCVALAALPMLVALGIGVFFAIRHPERLQSEEYRIQQRALQILYKRGSNAEIVDVTKDIVRTERLPGRMGDGEKP